MGVSNMAMGCALNPFCAHPTYIDRRVEYGYKMCLFTDPLNPFYAHPTYIDG